MALTCPRCGTDVPKEALYCPYCSLPKPRSGFAVAAPGKPEDPKPTEHPKRPSAFRGSNEKSNKPAKRIPARPGKPPRRLRLPVVSVAALVALFSVGIYIFVVPLISFDQAEPKTVLYALEKLRRMPSSDSGVTIDARLSRELEKSRRVGNLVGYQGWTMQPVKGSKTKVLFVYSYQEVGDVHQRAEWIADLTNNTFAPQTELAAAVYGKQ